MYGKCKFINCVGNTTTKVCICILGREKCRYELNHKIDLKKGTNVWILIYIVLDTFK